MASFISVLKKIGQVIVAGASVSSEVMGFPFVAQLLTGLSPKVGTVVTTATSDLNALAGIITTAEVMFPSVAGAKTGSAKLAASTPLVQQALAAWAASALPGKKPLDLALATQGAGKITDGLADFLNAYGD